MTHETARRTARSQRSAAPPTTRPSGSVSAPGFVPLHGLAVRRMTNPTAKKAPEVTTLVALNARLKELNLKPVLSEELETTDKALDAAVAASTLSLAKGTTRGAVLSALKSALTNPAKSKQPTVLEARKQQAKECPTFGGEYHGGAANQLHVHAYGGGFHLKGPGGRYDIVQNGKLYADKLKEARAALSAYEKKGAALTLHAAIDKALLAAGQPLDTY